MASRVRRHGRGFRGVVSIHGRRRYGPTFATEAEAAQWVERFVGAPLPARIVTLADGYKLLEEDLQATGARPATADYYAAHYRIVTSADGWAPGWPLHRVSVDQVERYVRKRMEAGVAAATAWGKEIATLQRILRLAVRQGHLPADPLERLRRPRLRARRFGVLSAARVAELVAAIRQSPQRAAQRDSDIVALTFLTAMRRAELARLRAEDVDRQLGRIVVDGKTGPREIPIGAECDVVIGRLLLRARGGLVVGTVRTIEKVFERWQRRLGEPLLAPHVMRHSAITAMARAGVTPYVLRSITGHASLQQLLRYYHSQGDQNRAAVAALSLQPDPGTTRAGSPAQDPQDAARAN